MRIVSHLQKPCYLMAETLLSSFLLLLTLCSCRQIRSALSKPTIACQRCSQTQFTLLHSHHKRPPLHFIHSFQILHSHIKNMTELIRRRHSFFIDFNDAQAVDQFNFESNQVSTSHFESKREDRVTIPFSFTSVDPLVCIIFICSNKGC